MDPTRIMRIKVTATEMPILSSSVRPLLIFRFNDGDTSVGVDIRVEIVGVNEVVVVVCPTILFISSHRARALACKVLVIMITMKTQLVIHRIVPEVENLNE